MRLSKKLSLGLVALATLAVTTVTNTQEVAAKDTGSVKMYRLYHKGTYEHFYTGDKNEAQTLVNGGWVSEGVGFVAPKKSNTPVYRLYQPQLKDHHYTTSKNERDTLVKNHGWKDEGIGWYSSDAKKIALHRLYQPKLTSGSHHYTTSSNEKSTLASQHGWKYEGVSWYAIGGGDPAEKIAPTVWKSSETFTKHIAVKTYTRYLENAKANPGQVSVGIGHGPYQNVQTYLDSFYKWDGPDYDKAVGKGNWKLEKVEVQYLDEGDNAWRTVYLNK
jgi:ribosomal protein L33